MPLGVYWTLPSNEGTSVSRLYGDRRSGACLLRARWKNAWLSCGAVALPDAFVCNDNLAAFGLLKACKENRRAEDRHCGV